MADQVESQACQVEDQTDLVEVKKHMEPWAYQTDLVRHTGLAAEACCMQAAWAGCCSRKECEVARQPVADRKGAQSHSVVELAELENYSREIAPPKENRSETFSC